MTRRCAKCGKPIRIDKGRKQTLYRAHVRKCTGFDMRVVHLNKEEMAICRAILAPPKNYPQSYRELAEWLRAQL